MNLSLLKTYMGEKILFNIKLLAFYVISLKLMYGQTFIEHGFTKQFLEFFRKIR